MSHQQHDIFESRKQFQLERIILFSDAVFAIAITLLIIEIKIPHFDTAVSAHQVAEALEEKIPEFISFVLSFAVIGQFWTNHHKLFGYITNYTSGLLWLNLLMLLFVVVMPFSTFLIMQFGNLDLIWLWYSTNLAMIGFALYLMWRYVSKHKGLTYISDNVSFMKLSRRRSLVLTAIFLFGGLLTFLPWDSVKYLSRFVFILIFPVLRLMSRRYDKKYPNKRPAH